jgi:MoxR-like ATPase
MELAELRDRASAILDEVERAVVGKRDALELILAAMLCDGHVLLEDYPGLAKTLTARSFSQAMSLQFSRIQFTPDLMPSDVTGSSVFDQRRAEFEFLPGPIFTNLLLADEINRAPPKTQAALLEAMQEQQVTIEGETRALGAPFIVLATQNPMEYAGTYPLPESQVDRFMMRLSMGYPTAGAEAGMLAAHETGDRVLELEPVADTTEVLALQDAAARVRATPPLRDYIVSLLGHTRADPRVELGASPRAGVMLLRAAKARALLEGRDHALPDDVQALAQPVLAHRIVLAPEAAEASGGAVVADAISRTAAL